MLSLISHGAWCVLALSLAQTQPATAPAGSDSQIVMQMAALATPDRTQPDSQAMVQAFLLSVQKLPPLAEQLEKEYPASPYLPEAYSLLLNAMITARQVDPASFTNEAIAQAAQKLQTTATKQEHRAQAQFVLLQVEGLKTLAAVQEAATSAPASGPASAPAKMAATTSAPTTSPADQLMADLAGKFLRYAEEFSLSTYAAPALMQAADLYVEGQMYDQAAATYERVVKEYPKQEDTGVPALMILSQLYSQMGQTAKSLAAKQKLVDLYPDSRAAMKYRTDLSRAQSVGKAFDLRFRSISGEQVDSAKLRGKGVLVLFFGSITATAFTDPTVEMIRGLDQLTQKQGYVLLAVGAESEKASEGALAIYKNNGLTVPTLMDPEGKVAGTFSIETIPSVLVVDAQGKVTGVIAATDIVAAVKQYFQSPPATKPAKAPTAEQKKILFGK